MGAERVIEESMMIINSLISVVDDDESVRESLPDLLREFGFAARAFSPAEEFLASDCVGETRCLVLDIAMPGMSGPDLHRELTRRQHEIPIVFVVDDDVSVRESLELLISSAGWQPEIFPSAQEFLAHPRANVPSCLVLDMALPDLNGLDVQKRVVDRTDMPIIFITGYGDAPMTVQAMKAGAVEFLTKPFGDDVLLGAIRNAIERSRTALGHEA